MAPDPSTRAPFSTSQASAPDASDVEFTRRPEWSPRPDSNR